MVRRATRDVRGRGAPASRASQLAAPTTAEAASAKIAGISASMLMALFFLSLMLPIEPRIGPIRMTPYNALQIVLFIPLLVRFRNDPSNRLVPLDVFMALYVSWIALAIYHHHGTVAGGLHRQPDRDDLRRLPDRAGDDPQRRRLPALLHLLLLGPRDLPAVRGVRAADPAHAGERVLRQVHRRASPRRTGAAPGPVPRSGLHGAFDPLRPLLLARRGQLLLHLPRRAGEAADPHRAGGVHDLHLALLGADHRARDADHADRLGPHPEDLRLPLVRADHHVCAASSRSSSWITRTGSSAS